MHIYICKYSVCGEKYQKQLDALNVRNAHAFEVSNLLITCERSFDWRLDAVFFYIHIGQLILYLHFSSCMNYDQHQQKFYFFRLNLCSFKFKFKFELDWIKRICTQMMQKRWDVQFYLVFIHNRSVVCMIPSHTVTNDANKIFLSHSQPQNQRKKTKQTRLIHISYFRLWLF